MMRRTEFLPFGKPDFSDQEIAAVTRVLRSGWVGMGPETIAFERDLAEYFDVPHVVAVDSCTSALFLSLLISGVGPGDEVICPSLTWCSTANAALYLGATPVFCDVDPKTFCLTPETILEKCTSRTKAVMAVHYGGLAADIRSIRAVLPRNVVIIEDAAHAIGARSLDGKLVGSSGNLTCFSFYANKNLSTGDGGAVALSDPAAAERLRSLRQHGLPSDAWKRFSHPNSLLSGTLEELGYKMNYTDLQASIGRVQLKRQKEFSAVRLCIARLYAESLARFTEPPIPQARILDLGHARHLFAIELPLEAMTISRDELILRLRAENIGASIHYAPLHLMPIYGQAGRTALPHTERLSKRILTLPISASMSMEDATGVMRCFEYLLGQVLAVSR
jgi:perosamine synthetase